MIAGRYFRVAHGAIYGSSVSYWSNGEDVYRLPSEEPSTHDIDGSPSGLRWESSARQWDRYANADHLAWLSHDTTAQLTASDACPIQATYIERRQDG